MLANDEIAHVVLLMLENHSFDQMLGCMQEVYPELDGVDMNATSPRFNLDLAGNPVFQVPGDEQQVPLDPKHEHRFVMEQIGDKNSGFVVDFQKNVKGNSARDRQYIMSYYLLGRLQALHQLGQNFTVCDNWFSSLPGPTWPNRFFTLSGTSSGRVLMPEGLPHLRLKELFVQNQYTLFDRLREAGKSHRIYYYDFPSSLLLNRQRLPENLLAYRRFNDFFTDVLQEETFPAFAFIEPKYFGADQNDDHPPHNIFKAEKLIADVYNAIRSNPDLWRRTLLLVVYDEHGGFYDHVTPPQAIPPDNHREEWTFDQLGVRVPAILISPWVGARVEKTLFDHTSLLRYLIDKWNLNPLGERATQANSIEVVLNQREFREDTIPFIRVPYTDLMPERVDLEMEDASEHRKALYVFSQFLDGRTDVTVKEVLGEFEESNPFTKVKAGFGKLLLRFGSALTGDLQMVRQRRVQRTTEVARRQLIPDIGDDLAETS